MIKAFFVCAVVVCGLNAQRPGRSIATHADGVYLGYSGDDEVALSYAGQLSYVRIAAASFARVTTAVVVPGCLHVLSGQEVLIGGKDASGGGVLEHWAFGSGSLTLKSSATFAGADIAGVVYAPSVNTLYFLDCVTKRILKATWSPPVSLASIAPSPWVDQTVVADLANADERTLVPEVLGSTPKLRLRCWPFVDYEIGTLVTDTGSGLTVGQFSASLPLPVKDVSADETSASEGSVTLRVFAPSGVAFEVVDLDLGVTVANGVGGSNGEAMVTLNQPAVLGRHYTAQRVGQPVASDMGFTCVRRYGFAETFADGTMIQPTYFQMGAEIGRQFMPEVGLRHSGSPLGADLVYDGMLMVGFRTGGVDPVVPYGSNWLLASATYLPARGIVSSKNGWGLAFSAIGIPNDPGLVGLTFLTQFVMEDGQDYRLSEVYGSTIGGAASLSSTSSGGSQALSLAHQHMLSAISQGRAFESAARLLHVLSRRP